MFKIPEYRFLKIKFLKTRCRPQVRSPLVRISLEDEAVVTLRSLTSFFGLVYLFLERRNILYTVNFRIRRREKVFINFETFNSIFEKFCEYSKLILLPLK